MLGLVEYEGSSDEEDSNDEGSPRSAHVQINSQTHTTGPDSHISDEENSVDNNSDNLDNLKLSLEGNAFHLPTPTSHNLKPPIKTTKNQGGVKILIPSLDEFDEEEEEEAKPRKAKLTASTKGCGLFSMLPKPRNEFLATPRQLPSSRARVSTAPAQPKPTRLGATSTGSGPASTGSGPASTGSGPASTGSGPASTGSGPASTGSGPASTAFAPVDDEEEDDGGEAGDFFTIPDKTDPADDLLVPDRTLEEYMKPIVPRGDSKSDERAQSASAGPDDALPECSVATAPLEMSPSDSQEIELNNDVLRKLGARKRKGEDLIVRDVDGGSLVPDAKEWLTKQLSAETAYRPSHKKHDGPTSQQKRKHQITYLAFQAKANELDLKNQWANNRQSKRQTQSKYGF